MRLEGLVQQWTTSNGKFDKKKPRTLLAEGALPDRQRASLAIGTATANKS